jgi:hypothetical protein
MKTTLLHQLAQLLQRFVFWILTDIIIRYTGVARRSAGAQGLQQARDHLTSTGCSPQSIVSLQVLEKQDRGVVTPTHCSKIPPARKRLYLQQHSVCMDMATASTPAVAHYCPLGRISSHKCRVSPTLTMQQPHYAADSSCRRLSQSSCSSCWPTHTVSSQLVWITQQ